MARCNRQFKYFTALAWAFPWLELIWADGGYNASQVEAAIGPDAACAWKLSNGRTTGAISSSCPGDGWLSRNHRLAKGFENLAETLAIFVPSPPFSVP